MRSSIASEPSASRFSDRSAPAFRRPRSWLFLLGLWTVLPLALATSMDLAMGRPADAPGSWQEILHYLLIWCPWVPLTPLVVALGRRFPLRSPRVPLHALIHLLASWLVAVALNLYLAAATAVLPVEWSAAEVLSQAFRVFEGFGALSQILYWTVLAASITLASYQRSRQRAALLAEARLESLKAQVRPHFLFNTLNTISTLMDEDVHQARRMISHLSELLRASLQGRAAQEVTLGEELELVGLYLEIEKVRFEDRLRPRFEIEDETRDALVPHLMLQPLVENAILHGISRDSTAGELRLEARRLGGLLRLRIHDDGPGPPEPGSGEPGVGEGIGLANARARLDELYGRAGRLALRRRRPRGTTVEVEVPFHLRGVEEAA